MLPVVVVPMLNEEAGIEATCRSLGFGQGAPTSGTVLVLVDNGSTDRTLDVAEGIRAASGPERVIIVQERERGYVPARTAGIRAVVEHIDRIGSPPEQTLVLQADADTIYEPGYVDAMAATARARGRGHLFEGVSIPPRSVDDPCRLFRQLEASIDDAALSVPFELDVVVDDKVAAFILADYDSWGGHRHEYRRAPPHDELLAETTRLYIAARLTLGVRRIAVEDGMATTSSRRILENPALAFATAGLPRELSWISRWSRSYGGPRSLDEFRIGNEWLLTEAIAMRRRHLAALFRFLPEIVASADRGRAHGTVGQGLEEFSSLARGELRPADRRAAGNLLEDVFDRAGVA